MLTTLAICNYRSLRNLVVPLQRLNVITGANGSGKSSLYRALRLLADTAQGRVVPSLAREGGLQSTLWAGPESISRSMKQGDHPVQGTRRQHSVNLRLGFSGKSSATGSIWAFRRRVLLRLAWTLRLNTSASGTGRCFAPRRCWWIGRGRLFVFAERVKTGA